MLFIWEYFSDHAAQCPANMAAATANVCIDRLPYPNYEGEGPLLGLSATTEHYLPLGGETWDAETLCASVGKRVCSWNEWQSACDGTPTAACQPVQAYAAPNWARVTARSSTELLRLDQHASPTEYPDCRGITGARVMLGNVQEWVRHAQGHALTRGYWSRPGDCHAINSAHAANWHDYATGTRCCFELQAPPITLI